MKPEILNLNFEIFSRSKLGNGVRNPRVCISVRHGIGFHYVPIPEAFCMVYTDETEAPGIEAASELGGVEAGWISV